MIEFVTGNFFDYDAEVRVNTVNCVGVMGAGAALQFKNKFPKMFDEYVRECKLGRVKIGRPHVWKDQEFFNHSPIIINFPTKDHWKKPSEYEYVEKGLVWLREYLQETKPASITVPALGCGHGGLDWGQVRPMIENQLANLSMRIIVFEPESSTKVESSPELEAELKAKNINTLIPSDLSYPRQLTGKSAAEIYVKGNTKLLENKSILSILVNSKAAERDRAAAMQLIETLPSESNVVCLMNYNSSFEIDLIGKLLDKKIKVILMAPYGILNLKLRKDILGQWNEERMLVISLSKPKQSWSAIEGIKGLKFRLAMAKSVLISSEDLSFFEKYEKEFVEQQKPYFYLNFWNIKPTFLETLNAVKLGRDKVSSILNLSGMLSSLSN
ncbi:hypothetical protein AQ505_12445 [Pedobacter sp. PACM 27299]|uniref:macro domain-containing protein n=1 Tax=Pedobacter sp. PACM 27299 TaxID=1727164 RepID=UPI0007059133|nr:macro domain-containing protein [Pedobacter sp. PACM 27299]ALL06230.1 hypothetical protein AQ505_12445 [Pedobacter sp. PACM 27299]